MSKHCSVFVHLANRWQKLKRSKNVYTQHQLVTNWTFQIGKIIVNSRQIIWPFSVILLFPWAYSWFLFNKKYKKMVSRLVLSASLGSLGFLTFLIVQSRQRLGETLFGQIRSSNPLAAFSTETFSSQDPVCNRADKLLALLSGWLLLFFFFFLVTATQS